MLDMVVHFSRSTTLTVRHKEIILNSFERAQNSNSNLRNNSKIREFLTNKCRAAYCFVLEGVHVLVSCSFRV